MVQAVDDVPVHETVKEKGENRILDVLDSRHAVKTSFSSNTQRQQAHEQENSGTGPPRLAVRRNGALLALAPLWTFRFVTAFLGPIKDVAHISWESVLSVSGSAEMAHPTTPYHISFDVRAHLELQESTHI